MLFKSIADESSSSITGRPFHVSKLRSEFDSGNSSLSYSVFFSYSDIRR